MNRFKEKFEEQLLAFWETATADEKSKTLADVLEYANFNPQSFKKDFKEIEFDDQIEPLSVVMEALSKDSDIWGHFFVEILDDVLTTQNQIDSPRKILNNLMEFSYTEKDTRPYVQKIVDRLSKEVDSANEAVKLASICTLPSYLDNPSIKNKQPIITSLQQLLDDKNWKVRYVAFKYLGFESLVPEGRQLALKDKLFKLILGEPHYK